MGVRLICVYLLCNTPDFQISHFKILLSAANDVDTGPVNLREGLFR